MPNPARAQLALKMRNHLGIGRADADRLINFFVVPIEPLGHVAGLGSFVQ